MIIKPKIFISYAREDIDCARRLAEKLKSNSFSIFFDEESIFVGENFPKSIVNFIKKSDAIILIITKNTLSSDWCKLEANYAFFYKKEIIPIKIGENLINDSPLNLLQKEINWFQIHSCENIESIYVKIQERLLNTRRIFKYKIIKLFTLTLGTLLIMFLGLVYLVGNLNMINIKKESTKTVNKIKDSKKILNTIELKYYKSKFSGNQNFIDEIYKVYNDKQNHQATILNANILTGSLSYAQPLNKKITIDDLNWENSEFSYTNLLNIYFKSGEINRVKFEYANLYDVVFSEKEIIEDCHFRNCKLNGVIFNNTNVNSTRFIAAKIYGCYFNTTNFFDVKFLNYINPNDMNSNNISTSSTTTIENCIFQNDKIMDLKVNYDFNQESIIKFEDINFIRCRFIGLIRPEWFENCRFSDCIFPNLSISHSLSQKNSVE